MARFVPIGGAVSIAFAAAAVSLTAATPAPSTQIAYVGKIPRLKTYALYSISTDGSDRRLITPYGRVTPSTTFSWSPDGKQIAFTRGQENGQIIVVNVDGSGVKRLTASPPGSANPSWSPDGELIVFDRNDPAGHEQIWVMRPDGTGKRKLTRSAQLNEWPSWSPDSGKIVFERYFGGNRMELYTMNRDGGAKRKIARVRTRTTASGQYWCACAAWSPDGTKIAYEAMTGKGKPGIFVMNADGTGRTQLTHLAQTREENPDWSPDGHQIAFYSERFGNAEIVVMNADGTNQHRITRDPWYDCCPRWKPSPEGSG